MTFPPDQARAPTAAGSASRSEDKPLEKTLDLKALAAVDRDGRVEVAHLHDQTLDAFDQTLRIIGDGAGGYVCETFDERQLAARMESAPEDGELRKLYVFAEILGGYETVNDLTRSNSPQRILSLKYGNRVLHRPLAPDEVRRLTEYYAELKRAIESARDYYRHTGLTGLSLEETHELFSLVQTARDKTKEVTEILGKNLILQIGQAVERLYEIRQAILRVERTVSGIFLVDNEVMFIPTAELIEIIDAIFTGVGNPYLADNIDGVLLLAARNLIIEVVSFYSYYGKHQIYQLFKQGRAVERHRITLRIRHEIRNILYRCKANNKLVLTRIMAKEEEQLDLSIEAIQREAEREALEAVIRIMPVELPPPPPRKRGWLQRVFGWFGV